MAEVIFTFIVEDYIPPFIRNEFPVDGATTIGPDTLIAVDVLDDYGVNLSVLNVSVSGVPAYNGGFVSPYDGPQSNISATTTFDGYVGYHLILDNVNEFGSLTAYTTLLTGQDDYGNLLNDSFTFTTRNITHLDDLSTGLYEITLDLTFDTPMLQNEALINPANYYFNNNMYARKVNILNSNEVRLWVELYYGQESFTLTVDEDIKNIDGYSVESGSISVNPFRSDATFTNFNGRVRTWHESNIVANDTQRIYLAGIKGIDVFRKTSATGFSRWAQIFDSYGIDSMFVANYPEDIVITDTTAPYLTDRSPAPSSYALADTKISFRVVDLNTAIEIPTLRIYVNGQLAFSGEQDGWRTGWSGFIEVGYKNLMVELKPDTQFSSGSIITVRVMAQDLLDNQMDSSYNFIIYVPIGGFGMVPFGKAPFGGV